MHVHDAITYLQLASISMQTHILLLTNENCHHFIILVTKNENNNILQSINCTANEYYQYKRMMRCVCLKRKILGALARSRWPPRAP